MTENPGQWGPQGGYPPQGPGGYPPQQPAGYPPQQPSPGGTHLNSPLAILLSSRPAGLSAAGWLQPQPASGWISASAARGLWTSGPSRWRPGTQGAPAKKSPVMIIAIVAAAIVLLAAVGGIIMVLTRGGAASSRTSRSLQASLYRRRRSPPRSPQEPSREPTPTDHRSRRRAVPSISVTGFELIPASGWDVKKTGENVAQLSDGKSVFLGQSLQISQSTNPGQLCDAWHRDVAEGTSNGKFQEPKDADVGTTRLKAATCVAQVTVSGGQGTTKLYLFSLVSVRQSDGVTVIGTAYFTPDADTDQLNKDFTSMINSMLKSQAAGDRRPGGLGRCIDRNHWPT